MKRRIETIDEFINEKSTSELPKHWIENELKEQEMKLKNAEKAQAKWKKTLNFGKYLELRKNIVELCQEAYNEIKNTNLDEVLDAYKDWADLKKPIDMHKKKLEVGDTVEMDDLSPFRKPIKNEWKIISFNQGTSAGVEAIIQNIKTKDKRSEATRYLIKK